MAKLPIELERGVVKPPVRRTLNSKPKPIEKEIQIVKSKRPNKSVRAIINRLKAKKAK